MAYQNPGAGSELVESTQPGLAVAHQAPRLLARNAYDRTNRYGQECQAALGLRTWHAASDWSHWHRWNWIWGAWDSSGVSRILRL